MIRQKNLNFKLPFLTQLFVLTKSKYFSLISAYTPFLSNRQFLLGGGLIILLILGVIFFQINNVQKTEVAVDMKQKSSPEEISNSAKNEVLGEKTNNDDAAESSTEAKEKKDASPSATPLTLNDEILPEGLDLSIPPANTTPPNTEITPLEQLKQIAEKVVEKIFPKSTVETVIASVESIAIKKSDLERELSFRLNYLQYDKRPPLNVGKVEQEILDQMINNLIIEHYAKSQNIQVTEIELNNHYQQAVSSYGTEEKYLQKIYEIHKMDKSALLKRMEKELIEERLSKKVLKPLPQLIEEQKRKVTIERQS